MREAIVAQCSAPPSEPAKSAFLRFNAMGRMARSTTLEFDLDPAVVEEPRQTCPARERVADGLRPAARPDSRWQTDWSLPWLSRFAPISTRTP